MTSTKLDFKDSQRSFSNKTSSVASNNHSLEPKKISLHTNSAFAERSNDKRKQCKFCNVPGHSMYTCRKYSSHEARVARCNDLKLCQQCTSSKHTENCSAKLDYSCNFCDSKSHISAMCPNFKTNKVLTNLCSNVASKTASLLIFSKPDWSVIVQRAFTAFL